MITIYINILHFFYEFYKYLNTFANNLIRKYLPLDVEVRHISLREGEVDHN